MHTRRGSSLWQLGLLVVVLLSTVVNSQDSGWKAAQEADRLGRLPGQPEVDFAIYGGYITVNEAHGRAHYYILTEAAEEPEKKPLVIWHNGGPGCSSIAYGFAEELGPFFVNEGGKNLRVNPNSANKLANVVFVDSPVGVGFSYSNTSTDILTNGDNRTAIDNYAFVVNWLERFPQYKGRPLFLAGESYAGHYVPQLAKQIYDNNKNLSSNEKINFKGFMVGNPVTDYYYDGWGYVDFLYYHDMISDQLYYQIKQVCNFTETGRIITDPCARLVFTDALSEYGRIDPYSVYGPVCPLAFSGNGTAGHNSTAYRPPFNPVLGQFRREKYDPCQLYYSEIYYNRPEVQKALHANFTGIPYVWTPCSATLYANWQDTAQTVLPIYQELLAANLRIWVFSGDVDSVVPTTGTRYSLASLKLPTVVPWYPWYNKQQVGGREIVYEGNLTLVTVRGASHEVPLLKPREFYQVLRSFLRGALLPREPY